MEGANRSAGRVTGAKSERGDSRGDRGVSQTEARRPQSVLGSSGARTRKKVSEFHAAIQELKAAAIAQPAPITASLQKQPSEDAREAVPVKTPVRSDVQGSELDDGLSERALALRFKIDKSGIARWKTNPEKLAAYTRDRDPNGIAWEFRDGKYYPLAE